MAKIVEVIISDYQVEDFLVQYKKGRTEFYCGETLKLSDFSFQEKLVDDCENKIIENDKVKITKISEDSSVEIIGNNESPEEFKIIKPGIISVTFRYEVENQEQISNQVPNTNNTTIKTKDITIANGSLPYTGATVLGIIVTISALLLAVGLYIKYRKFRDIK